MNEEKKQLTVILLIVFIGLIGSSIAYPIFPPLFLHPTSNSIISPSWPESLRSIFLGLALAAYPLGQFIGSPILGGCSDRYGRKRILVFSLGGSVIGYLLSALALQFHWLWILLFSRFITGLMEGNLAIARAIATDLKGISKYKSLGRINGISAIGYIMGPLLGGFFSDNNLFVLFSFAFPFFLATLFALIATLLAMIKLQDKINPLSFNEVTIWQRFNFIARLKQLFKNNVFLKRLLIISTIYTFSIDIFFEFGPVYLTGLWAMTPANIAVYNAALCVALAIGSGWLAQRLSLHFSIMRILIGSMLITALIFGLMSIFPIRIFIFLLFALVGLSIATVNTNIMIQISNAADKTMQGEAMGAQLSLRMLGDAIICIVGGFLAVFSVTLPIALSCAIALIAAGLLWIQGSTHTMLAEKASI